MKTDAQVQQDALRELRWDPRVEATDVGVEVDRGVVTLTGTMPSFQVTQAVLGVARLTPGVNAVDDRLRITLNA